MSSNTDCDFYLIATSLEDMKRLISRMSLKFTPLNLCVYFQEANLEFIRIKHKIYNNWLAQMWSVLHNMQINPLNSSCPGTTYICQWKGSASVQEIAWCHYLNQCWLIVNWTLRNKHQWNSNQCIWKCLRNGGHFVQGEMSLLIV